MRSQRKLNKILIALLIMTFTSCSLTTVDERLVATEKSTTGKVVKLYYVEPGATGRDVIQVRRTTDANHEVVVKSYEYNLLKDVRFLSIDTLVLVLSDTTSFGASRRSDTVRLKIY